MIKITVLYAHPVDPNAFETYYSNTHMPLSVKINGIAKAETTKSLPGPDGGSPTYYRMAELISTIPENSNRHWVLPKDRPASATFPILPQEA